MTGAAILISIGVLLAVSGCQSTGRPYADFLYSYVSAVCASWLSDKPFFKMCKSRGIQPEKPTFNIPAQDWVLSDCQWNGKPAI